MQKLGWATYTTSICETSQNLSADDCQGGFCGSSDHGSGDTNGRGQNDEPFLAESITQEAL